jgi:hypothetical protein
VCAGVAIGLNALATSLLGALAATLPVRRSSLQFFHSASIEIYRKSFWGEPCS